MYHMKWQTMLGAGLLTLVIALLQPTVAHAQTTCNGTLRGNYTNDIIVNGGACTLNGATTTGSVLVSNNGTLLANGGTQISGSVLADGAGVITLNNVTVQGDVLLNNSQNLGMGRK